MPKYQPRPLRLRETAVAALAWHTHCYGLEMAAPVLLTQNSRCYSIQTMGTSQRSRRAHSAFAKWPLPVCNVWQRPRAEARLVQGLAHFARRAAILCRGPPPPCTSHRLYMPSACKQFYGEFPVSVHAWRPILLKAKTATRGTLPRAIPYRNGSLPSFFVGKKRTSRQRRGGIPPPKGGA